MNRNGDLAQHITHTLVKATVFENVCHFRTQVSAIVTHFLQAVFLTVHYVILLRQIPSVLLLMKHAEPQKGFGLTGQLVRHRIEAPQTATAIRKLVIAERGILCYNDLDCGLRQKKER